MAKSHADAFKEVSRKHEWAQKHVNDLKACLDGFINSNPYEIAPKLDVDLGQITYYCSKVTPLPDNLSLILGDALHNLRSTLDYLAYKMVERGGGIPGAHTFFPIFDSAKLYTESSPRRVEGMRQLAIEAINRLNPYKGGNHALWELHRLDIMDKHRLLLTVDHSNLGHSILPSESDELSNQGRIDPSIADSDALQNLAKTHPIPFPLKVGDELLTIPAAYSHVNVGFVVDVAINEPEVAVGHPLILLISRISD